MKLTLTTFYFFLCIAVGIGQVFNTLSAEHCALNAACAVNYSSIFDTKLREMTYHHNLDLLKLRDYLNQKTDPIVHDVEIMKTNTSTMMSNIGREFSNIYQTLGHDREFLNNLTQGLYELGKALHGEVAVRMDDVHKLVVELRGVQHDLAALQSRIKDSNIRNTYATQNIQTSKAPINCTVTENAFIRVLKHNLTFYKSAYDFAAKSVRRLTSDISLKDQEIRRLQLEVSNLKSQSTSSPLIKTRCDFPLGMENATIPDSSITASETHVNYSPAGSRLGSKSGWYTNDKSTSSDWLQIDLGTKHYITSLATQAAPCCEVRVTNYTIQFSSDGSHWHDYLENCHTKYFAGNADQITIVKQKLDPPIAAQFVRFNVIDYNRKQQMATNYVGMRTELYGCHM